MSQTFNLQLATDTLLVEAQRLGVRAEELKRITITVHASIIHLPEPQLQLIYRIRIPDASLANQLDWPEWNKEDVNFTDYLWQQTCLECFVAVASSAGYIEINASPNGKYALYQFQDYRAPSILPPTPLLQADEKTNAHIRWLNHSIEQKTLTAHALSNPHFDYKSSFVIPLNQLPLNLFNSTLFNVDTYSPDNKSASGIYVNQIHPCVILWFGESALYFATSHTSPPDFHQRRHWSKFNY